MRHLFFILQIFLLLLVLSRADAGPDADPKPEAEPEPLAGEGGPKPDAQFINANLVPSNEQVHSNLRQGFSGAMVVV